MLCKGFERFRGIRIRFSHGWKNHGPALIKPEIEGRQALFVVNRAPRKMKGVLSEGMVFDIGYADGVTPVLVIPEAPVPDGSRAG